MAGLKADPAVERWAHVRENTHLWFTWNKRNTRKTLLWGIIVPAGLAVLAYGTDRKWNLTGAQTMAEVRGEEKN
ncbi:uncharacterized protein BYT42DRAFT_565433 [Radiomyces spectabilis]|uniref:uncharacterized protein n=1 Tax=Radiomyces spectabilis TaxID=64574 RepID=UPI00221E535E|nr:uncharacterized protein BYT42DRAFT_565433 [Radiomyces spectabilis]KAI8381144.1 hypothetical protein BYT42DRAFT_565433 [Radiomyces spectabilis]